MCSPSSAVAKPGQDRPAQLTSFIGRERALADLDWLLQDARLVTLVGVGGVGKTRLALELTVTRQGQLADGTWLVDLASIADGSLVARTIASRLGLREQIGVPLETTLAEYLKPRSVLLLLDNCEHLLDAVAALAQTLLLQCPDLRVLATSREPLELPGEHVYQVPPLSLPDPDLLGDGGDDDVVDERLARSEAMALFLDRARAARPGFRLTSRNAMAVARICRHLDGLPLAIELTAARLKTFAVEQIAEKLVERFWLVTGASRTAVGRHRTLEASVDWSYALLSEPEQVLLRAVSVFVGGFSEEAAESVGCFQVLGLGDVNAVRTASPFACAQGELREQTSGSGVRLADARGTDRRSSPKTEDPRPDTVAVLAQLVGKSLVILEERGGQARYRLLETIRQYGLKKLREAGEEGLVRHHHAAYYTSLAHRAESELFRAEQLRWFERFETEHDNVRAALDWIASALAQGDTTLGPAGLEAGAALGWFWIARGYYSEGWRRLPALLRLTGPSVRTPARVDALHHASACCYILGDGAPIRGLLEEAVPLGRELGYARGTAMALKGLGVMAHAEGDPERAARLYDEGLAVARGAGDTIATYLLLIWRSDLERMRGELDRAAESLEEALRLTRGQGDRWWMGHALGRLAHLALLRGDFERATVLGQDGLSQRWELHDRQGAAWNLELLAWVAGAWGRHERAAGLLGAARAARERTGARLLPQEQDGHERTRAAACAALGEEAFTAAWDEGHARPPDRAVEYALAADTLATAQPGSWAPTPAGASRDGVLTARERETVRLIALGLSNRQIGEALVISRGAAANYVQRVFAKLGFHARAQVAAWAVEHGLGPGTDTAG